MQENKYNIHSWGGDEIKGDIEMCGHKTMKVFNYFIKFATADQSDCEKILMKHFSSIPVIHYFRINNFEIEYVL